MKKCNFAGVKNRKKCNLAMLYRKISAEIEAHLLSGNDKIMVVEGARQIGKSYIIREVGKRLFKNFVEINFVKDNETEGLFRNISIWLLAWLPAESWATSPTHSSFSMRFNTIHNT